MKTKIIKNTGYWILVVQDEAINAKYGATNKHPIMLGNMANFFDSGCWSLQDYRQKKSLRPSTLLRENSQLFFPKNEEQKKFVLSYLYSPEVDESGDISWFLFDSYVFDGDNPSCTDSNGHQYEAVACFSFKEASKRLYEQKLFWDAFDKDDLTLNEVRIPNPHRQMSDVAISLLDYKNKFVKTHKGNK